MLNRSRGKHLAKRDRENGFIKTIFMSSLKIGTVMVVVFSFILNLVRLPESNSFFTSQGSSDKSHISIQAIESQELIQDPIQNQVLMQESSIQNQESNTVAEKENEFVIIDDTLDEDHEEMLEEQSQDSIVEVLAEDF